jgi:3-deoxy-manno-octulosonate cytidylyltransferase (CMP-KDO synthetase)
MKIVAVIPARFAAQRFPGKPLALIAGKPMVEWVYRAAKKALPRVIVATDDLRIKNFIEGLGGESLMTSPACQSGTDRVAEVAKKVKADLYLNIQGDEPLMSAVTVKKVLALHKDRSLDMGTAATALNPAHWKDPNVVKVLADKKGYALYFSRAALPYFRDGDPAPQALESKILLKHLGIYSYKAAFLKTFVRWPAAFLETSEKLEQLRALENGARIKVALTPDDSVGVDRPEDAERVGKILQDRGRP